MKLIRFTAELLTGHKGAAVEVPFDPASKWGVAARQLRPGRRGHAAEGTLNGVPFESAIVGRSKRFYLLVDDALRRAAGAQVGDVVKVSIQPGKPDESRLA